MISASPVFPTAPKDEQGSAAYEEALPCSNYLHAITALPHSSPQEPEDESWRRKPHNTHERDVAQDTP